MRLATLVAAVALLPVSAASAAVDGGYVFDGGTTRQQQEVVRALDASTFDWGLVDVRIVIHIGRDIPSSATPGHIWLDANLLEAGTFAWGVVQHEYAHQVDVFLLNHAERERLHQALGGTSWCSPAVRHADLACERFASMLAWSYWPSPENCMRPWKRGGERHFRELLAMLLKGRG